MFQILLVWGSVISTTNNLWYSRIFWTSVIVDEKSWQFVDEKKRLVEIRRFVEKNFDYVGENFSEKVREIYYNKKTKKAIYGTTTEKLSIFFIDKILSMKSVSTRPSYIYYLRQQIMVTKSFWNPSWNKYSTWLRNWKTILH